MKRNLRVLIPIAALALANTGSLADPAYKSSDIVSHFSRAKKLGDPRAICVGTENECAKEVPDQTKAVDSFDLRVQFEFNSSTITPLARSNLDEFAKALKDPRLATGPFVVEGHTDGIGGDAFNLDLSMRRASAVVEYLTARGVETTRLEAKGYGKQRPLVKDLMSSANRRVETRLRAE